MLYKAKYRKSRKYKPVLLCKKEVIYMRMLSVIALLPVFAVIQYNLAKKLQKNG